MLNIRIQTNEFRKETFVDNTDTLQSVLNANGITPNMTVYIDSVPVARTDFNKSLEELAVNEGSIISAIIKQDCANK